MIMAVSVKTQDPYNGIVTHQLEELEHADLLDLRELINSTLQALELEGAAQL